MPEWKQKGKDEMEHSGCLSLVGVCHCDKSLMDGRANNIGQGRTGQDGLERLPWSKKRKQAD